MKAVRPNTMPCKAMGKRTTLGKRLLKPSFESAILARTIE